MIELEELNRCTNNQQFVKGEKQMGSTKTERQVKPLAAEGLDLSSIRIGEPKVKSELQLMMEAEIQRLKSLGLLVMQAAGGLFIGRGISISAPWVGEGFFQGKIVQGGAIFYNAGVPIAVWDAKAKVIRFANNESENLAVLEGEPTKTGSRFFRFFACRRPKTVDEEMNASNFDATSPFSIFISRRDEIDEGGEVDASYF